MVAQLLNRDRYTGKLFLLGMASGRIIVAENWSEISFTTVSGVKQTSFSGAGRSAISHNRTLAAIEYQHFGTARCLRVGAVHCIRSGHSRPIKSTILVKCDVFGWDRFTTSIQDIQIWEACFFRLLHNPNRVRSGLRIIRPSGIWRERQPD